VLGDQRRWQGEIEIVDGQHKKFGLACPGRVNRG
jgi:hypothetical protein